jgi:hypothetical protein
MVRPYVENDAEENLCGHWYGTDREPYTPMRSQANVLMKHWSLSVADPILIEDKG